ncbi:FecR domain-containing protein [Parabacteroides sp. OttesenSCG-928-G06]|nr:FecR domain-containing protein [Parabacteroides sp. OttesenSCG-928-G06]
MDEQHIEELLPRYCEGTATEQERKEVREWMAQSEENRRIVKDIHTLYLASDTLSFSHSERTEKALTAVGERIHPMRRTPWWQWIQRTAAILFIPLVIAFAWQYGKTPELSAHIIEVKTNPGMTTSFTLPDQTTVFLNAGSTLSYPAAFGDDIREVTLDGEAFFMVKKDADKRFVVATPHDAAIEVLGTQFNVDAYSTDPAITTTLIEGKVSFHYTKGKERKKITLSPRQKLVYDSASDQTFLQATAGESEVSWKDGKVLFANTPMKEVLRILEKRYDVRFIVKNEGIYENSFTGTFTNQRLERILEYFRVSSKINYTYLESLDIEQERNEIELY